MRVFPKVRIRDFIHFYTRVFGVLWRVIAIPLCAGWLNPLIAQDHSGIPTTLAPLAVPADTGRMAWGRHDYTSYTSAVACDRAVMHMQAEDWRTRVSDTLPYTLRGDTISPRTRAVARACSARFTVDGTSPVQLWSLLRVALAEGDERKASAIIERALSLVPTQTKRAQAFVKAITVLMAGNPPRITTAQALLQRLDSLGATEKIAQLDARVHMLSYWRSVYQVDSLRVYATAAIDLIKGMSTEERNMARNVRDPYSSLLDLANERGDLAMQEQLLNEALEMISGWQGGMNGPWVYENTLLVETRKQLYGKPTRALESRFMFNTRGAPRPAPNRFSLLVNVSHNCGDKCLSLYTLIRQLHTRYGDALDITLISATEGWAPEIGPLMAEEEAKIAAAYFLEQKKLPVGVMIDETPFTKRTDGRRERKPTKISSVFAGWRGANAVLIDRSSAIRWLGNMTSDRDRRLVMAAIDRVVNESSSPSCSPKLVIDTTSINPIDTIVPPLLGPSLRYGIDTTVSPCSDFYQYVNGGWRDETKLPNPTTGSGEIREFFQDTYTRTQKRLQETLDSARTVALTTSSPTLRVLGTFYESCMTTNSLDRLPIRGVLPKKPVRDSTRAEQCLRRSITSLGDALGYAFAQELLTSAALARMQQILDATRAAVIARVEANPWMTTSERTLAIERLARLQLRVGVPTQQVDYQALVLSPTNYPQNKLAVANFENQQQVAVMNGDMRTQWKASLITPNAFYRPADHAIEIPAVMFMLPFFDLNAEDAVNFASIGFVIAHEIFHSVAGQLPVVEHTEMKAQIERLKTLYTGMGTLDGWTSDGIRTFNEIGRAHV